MEEEEEGEEVEVEDVGWVEDVGREEEVEEVGEEVVEEVTWEEEVGEEEGREEVRWEEEVEEEGSFIMLLVPGRSDREHSRHTASTDLNQYVF